MDFAGGVPHRVPSADLRPSLFLAIMFGTHKCRMRLRWLLLQRVVDRVCEQRSRQRQQHWQVDHSARDPACAARGENRNGRRREHVHLRPQILLLLIRMAELLLQGASDARVCQRVVRIVAAVPALLQARPMQRLRGTLPWRGLEGGTPGMRRPWRFPQPSVRSQHPVCQPMPRTGHVLRRARSGGARGASRADRSAHEHCPDRPRWRRSQREHVSIIRIPSTRVRMGVAQHEQ